MEEKDALEQYNAEFLEAKEHLRAADALLGLADTHVTRAVQIGIELSDVMWSIRAAKVKVLEAWGIIDLWKLDEEENNNDKEK